MEACNACGEESVIDEDENGRRVRVCTACGVLQNNVQEYVTQNFQGTTLSDGQARGPKGVKSGSRSGPAKGILFGKENISRIGKCLSFSVDMIDAATSIYNRMYDKHLYKTAAGTKMAMCGACLFTTGRQNGRSVGVRDVCKYLDIEGPGKKIHKALGVLKKYEIQAPALSVSSETDNLLANTEFSAEVRQLTRDIMTLCDRYWLSQGRAHSITVTVAVYFAWRACKFPNESMDFTKFCEKYDFHFTRTTLERRTELEKVLKTSVQKIPWLKGKKIRSIDPYIKDAVTFQASLMEETLEAAALNAKPSLKAGSSQDGDNLQMDKDFGTLFRTKDIYKKKKNSDMKLELMKNVSLKRKRTTEETVSDSDLSMIDLGSDDDTDLYIRTEEEVESLKKIQYEITSYTTSQEG